MPQLYLRAVDIDGVTYTGGGLPDRPTDDTFNQRGYVNETRSKMVFKDVNLACVVGWDVWRNADKQSFNIKLIDVKTVDVVNTNLTIDVDSPAALRASNITVSGLQWYNGREKNCMGVVSNFNANNEEPYRVWYDNYYGGATPSFTIRWGFGSMAILNRTMEISDLFNNFLLPRNGNAVWLQSPRFRFNGSIPELEDKIFRFKSYSVVNTGVLQTVVEDAGDGTWPEFAPANVGANVTLTPLPSAGNSWHMLQKNERLQDDRQYGIELQFHKPKSPTVDITIELTDLLLNQLQPVITEPNGKAYPSFVFVFEIA